MIRWFVGEKKKTRKNSNSGNYRWARVPSLKVTRKQYKTPIHLSIFIRSRPPPSPIVLHFSWRIDSRAKIPRERVHHECVSWPIETFLLVQSHERSIVTLAISKNRGRKGGIRWQKKKEIRYVNGHCTPLKPRFLCLDAKIWKQIKFERGKGKKKGEITIFFLFFEILRTETLLTFKPLCTLQHVVKLYIWIYIIEQLAKMRQLKEPVKKFRQFSLPTIQKKLRPTFKLFEFRFKFPLTKVSKQFSSSFRGN